MAAADVPGNPAADRTIALRRVRQHEMGLTTAGGARLHQRKAASFSAAAPAIGTFCRPIRGSRSHLLAGQATMRNRDLDYPTTGWGIRGMSA
jgi:hypothetical protein